MEKGKLALVVGGGLVLAIGVGFAIYYGTKKDVTNNTGNTGGGSGGGSGSGTGGGGVTVGGMNFNLNDVQDALKSIADATKEKFPFRVGMFGPNIKAMQTALRTKFNQLDVKSDGIFGPKTFKALRAIGYADLINNTIDDEEFLDIIDGKRKITT